jgi:RNA polymerase sigma factor (sigma-70 family)
MNLRPTSCGSLTKIKKDATKSEKSSVPYGRTNVSGILDAMMNTRTDSDLMAAYADACDENAFAELVARHQRMVYRVCLRMLRHHQEAEDATQAVFLVLLNKASRLTRTGELTGWLYGVARNVCLEALRKRARRQEEAMLDETEEPAVEEYRPAHEEVMPFLDEELAGLTGVLRQAVVLRYLQGYSQAEAARHADCSEVTLSVRASRGIERLRQRAPHQQQQCWRRER